jgi:hypothetical protein
MESATNDISAGQDDSGDTLVLTGRIGLTTDTITIGAIMKSTLSILTFAFGTLFATAAAYADQTVTFANGRTICVHTNASGQGTHWSEGACPERIEQDDPDEVLRARHIRAQDNEPTGVYIEDNEGRLRASRSRVEEDDDVDCRIDEAVLVDGSWEEDCD